MTGTATHTLRSPSANSRGGLGASVLQSHHQLFNHSPYRRHFLPASTARNTTFPTCAGASPLSDDRLAYLGGGSVLPAGSPPFLNINHIASHLSVPFVAESERKGDRFAKLQKAFADD